MSKRKHTGSESDEVPVKSVNNEEVTQSMDTNGKPKEPSPRKNFAQTFAYLKNTDMYKLPEKPAEVKPAAPRNSNAITVNSCQRGNPILKFVKNVPWEFGDIIPDYQVGERHCVLFLSLRYHNLNPNYIHDRLSLLGNSYDLRVLLVLVDIKNCRHNLKELSKMCMLAGCTLILSWSAEEAGRYLETYKQFENKPPDVLQERVETDYFSQVQDVLTTIKSVNKTDAITLISAFGSLKNVINSSMEEVVLCPGFGKQKAQRLHKVFNEPFKRGTGSASCSQEHSSPSVKDGLLPATSKLKRPSEVNVSLRKSDSNSPPHKLKSTPDKVENNKVEDEKITSASATSLSPSHISKSVTSVEQPNRDTNSDKPGNELEEKCIEDAHTDKSIDAIQINQVVKDLFEKTPANTETKNKKSDPSDSPLKQTDLKRSSSTTRDHNSYSPTKMSKTAAIYNSGLSRNRKEGRDEMGIKTMKSSPLKTPEKHSEKYPKTDHKSLAKKTPDKHHTEKPSKTSEKHHHFENSSRTPDKSRTENRHEKHSEKHAGSKKTETSQVSKTMVKKDSVSVSGKATSRVLTTDNDITLKNDGKFRVGSRKSRPTEVEKTPVESPRKQHTTFSTEITNEEFDDLLASDDDNDDNMYADIL